MGGPFTSASFMDSLASVTLGQLRRLGNAPRRVFSSERGRAAARAAIGALLARPLNMLLSMATTAVLVRFMGVEQFGTWAMWQNLAGVLGVFALGVPLSLMNHVSTARAAADERRLSQILSTAFFMMVAAGAVVIVAATGWITVDDSLGGLARADGRPGDRAITACAAVFIVYAAINLAAGLFDRVTTAYQDGWISAGCQVVGSAISLGLVGLACWLRASLPIVAAAWAAGALLGLAINAVVARVRYGGWAMPRLASFSAREMWQLLADGWQFMLLGFIGLLTLQSDPLLIGIWDAFQAAPGGSRAVAEMAIPLRFFNIASAVILVFLAPLWPAYADARARGDIEWSRRTLVRSLLATAAVAILLVVPASIWGETLLVWWVGEEVAVPPSLLLAFGGWAIVTVVSYPVVMYLNGFGQLRFQLSMGLLFMLFAVPAKFVGLAWFGPTGMITATVIVFIILQLVPLLWLAFTLTRPAKAA
jgi:O-antigen/teichoic acid export membrane protein